MKFGFVGSGDPPQLPLHPTTPQSLHLSVDPLPPLPPAAACEVNTCGEGDLGLRPGGGDVCLGFMLRKGEGAFLFGWPRGGVGFLFFHAGLYEGDVGLYEGEVGLYEGEVGLYEGDVGLYEGEVGLYEGEVGLYEGEVGLYEGEVGLFEGTDGGTAVAGVGAVGCGAEDGVCTAGAGAGCGAAGGRAVGGGAGAGCGAAGAEAGCGTTGAGGLTCIGGCRGGAAACSISAFRMQAGLLQLFHPGLPVLFKQNLQAAKKQE